MQISEVLSLSIAERIQLVEDIWDTIAAGIDSTEISEEEKKIINQRLESFHNNPSKISPWKDVIKRISKN